MGTIMADWRVEVEGLLADVGGAKMNHCPPLVAHARPG